MNQSELLLRILLTIAFGAILGLETETRAISKTGLLKAKKEEFKRIGGLRTYTVLSLIGGIAGIFYNEKAYPIVYITFSSVAALVVSAYVMNIKLKEAFGITTEIAILITFLMGFLTTSKLVDLTTILVILVLLTFFLSQKRGFGSLVSGISHDELIDILKFGLTSIVVLPLLPNQTYTVSDLLTLGDLKNLNITDTRILEMNILNPFRMWLIVVIISGISLIGFLLNKILGANKGILLTSIFGGFVSSTSTLISLASKAKDKKDGLRLAGGAIISNAISFITALLLLSALSTKILNALYPSLIAMLAIGFITGCVMILLSDKLGYDKNQKLELEKYKFSILPGIKFVFLIIVISLAIQFISIWGTEKLLIFVTSLSGATGLDPSLVATAEIFNSGNFNLQTAAFMILAANAINFMAKIIYSLLYGNPKFAMYVTIGLMITLVGSFTYFIS